MSQKLVSLCPSTAGAYVTSRLTKNKKPLKSAKAALSTTQISLCHANPATAQRQLENSRVVLAAAAADVLKTRRGVDEFAIGALEGVKFGTVTRGASAEATYLALMEGTMGEKLR